jgi:hypothetical protein
MEASCHGREKTPAEVLEAEIALVEDVRIIPWEVGGVLLKSQVGVVARPRCESAARLSLLL